MRIKAKLNEIRVWYKFKPQLRIWLSKYKHKSEIIKTEDETWYGGYWFHKGYFILLQLGFCLIHIKFTWWQMKGFGQK